MNELEITELHEIIGTSCEWMRRDALAFVNRQDSYIRMSMVRALVGLPWERGGTLDEALSDFRRLPPTVMLGLYDRARWEQRTNAYD